jgi:hypothetical protein
VPVGLRTTTNTLLKLAGVLAKNLNDYFVNNVKEIATLQTRLVVGTCDETL